MDYEGAIEKLQSVLLQIIKQKRDIPAISNFQVRIIGKYRNKELLVSGQNMFRTLFVFI